MITDYLAKLRRIHRDARLMIAAQAIMGFSYVGVYSVLFNLYLLRLGYDPAGIGQINGADFGENYHGFRSKITTHSERSDAGCLIIVKW